MLTISEKRFIQYWEDQRKGGKFKYCLLYILTGTFIGSIVTAFLAAILGLGFPNNLVWIVLAAFIIVTTATVVSWGRNEKKFKSIIQREIKKGKEEDDKRNATGE